jgi:hypothetical protein
MKSMCILFIYTFESPISVKEVNAVEVEPLVVAAQANLVRNIAVLREIANVTLQDLDTFWSCVKLLEFDGPVLGYMLIGLSSMDSSRVYISRKRVICADQLVGQRALEFEYANSLSRWRKDNPYLVSVCIDRKLRAVDCHDAVVGAGHFYEERVHKKRATMPFPFDLNCVIFRRN